MPHFFERSYLNVNVWKKYPFVKPFIVGKHDLADTILTKMNCEGYTIDCSHYWISKAEVRVMKVS